MSRAGVLACWVVLVAVGQPPGLSGGVQAAEKKAAPQVRKFRFVYAGVVDKLEPGAQARVWLPQATTGNEQTVVRERVLLPGPFQETREKKFGNRTLYFETTANAAGEIPFEVVYLVERKELVSQNAEAVSNMAAELFLAATLLEPADGSLTQKVFGTERPRGEGLQLARTLYDAVNGRMQYGKPADLPWGRGDARWACDSRVGNCTDFHALFISLCREHKIPAAFEIGFPLPEQRGDGEVAGYHCWAKFAWQGHWVPVDISEANKNPALKEYYFGNLSPDRVAFTSGRDLQLDPPPAAKAINFHVYPYVEVEGKPHTSLAKKFRYQDVD